MISSNYNSFYYCFIRNFFFALAYFIGAFAVLMFFLRFTNNQTVFNRDSFMHWDAIHYEHIAHIDYLGFRTAFFPLFPLIWKILRCGIYGVVLFNGILFIFSASLLVTFFKFSAEEFLIILSFPSLIFLFLPYTESVFFFSVALALIGMSKQNNWIIFVGMLLASCTRPVVYVFIPAVIILNIIENRKLTLQRFIFLILPILLGIILVFFIQYFNTHDYFAFFHSQKMWNNYLQIPKFHLTSWGGDDIVKLDGSAFLVGIIATVAIAYFAFKKSTIGESMKQEPTLFSIIYLAGICWFVLFTRGGSLFSLNRFVFATPFFFLGFSALLKKSWTTREYVLIFLLLNVFWLLLGSYVHIVETLKYLALSVFVMLFLFISHPNKYISKISYSVCLIGNIFLQLYFYNSFLHNGWVG